MKRNILCIVLYCFSHLLFSQTTVSKDNNKLSAYTNFFLSNIKEEGEGKKATATRRLSNNPEEDKEERKTEITAYIVLNDNADLKCLEDLGVKINSVFDHIITAQIPIQNINKISDLNEVKRIEMAYPVKQRLDKARVSSNAEKIENYYDGIGGKKYTGKGVVIGVIDYGFDYNHINFFDRERKNLRIKRVWVQSKKGGTPPKGYNYGTEYKTEKDILGAAYDSRYATHGTHVLGIATGADKSNNNHYYGLAPEADIVLVSYTLGNNYSDNTTISDGIKYIYDYADSVGKPCVINMSLGSHYGPHDGTSLFDELADGMQGEGRLLVGSAGNEGESRLHVSKKLKTNNDTLKTLLEFPDSYSLFREPTRTAIEIWGDVNNHFNIQFCIYDETTATQKNISNIIKGSESDSPYGKKYRLNQNGFSGEIKIYVSEKNDRNDRYSISIFIDMSKVPRKKHLGLKIFNSTGTIHAWLADERTKFINKNLKGWSAANANSTIGEIGGTGKKIISVGAYVSKNRWRNLSGKSQYYSENRENSLAYFSSIGPTVDGRIKPEITAPGSSVISSYSSSEDVINEEKENLVKKTILENKSYYYGEMSGTSMASPMVTGILALWLEAKNDLTPENVREILKKTAKKDLFTGIYENNKWGYGKIDAYKGLLECLKMKDTAHNIGVHSNKNLIKIESVNLNHKEMEISSLKEGLTPFNIIIWSTDGKMILKKSESILMNEIKTIDLSDFSRGVYIVKLEIEGAKDVVEKIIL